MTNEAEMAETLRPKDYRFIAICVLICAASLFVGIRYFYRAFPEASIDFRFDRDSSKPLAEKFLAARALTTDGYRHASSFSYDDETKVFLERELGLERTNELAINQVKLWRWGHRWFKPQQKEEIRVEITTKGEVASFLHLLPEDTPGADLTPEAARAIAESFLAGEMRRPMDSLEFVDIQTQKRPRRTDHEFIWKIRGVDLRNASYRVSIVVHGNRVDGYREFVKIPEEWSRGYARLRSLNESTAQVDLLFMALLGVSMLVMFGKGLRLRDVRWRTILAFGIIAFVLQFLAMLNEFPLAEYGFDTTGSYASFAGRFILIAAVAALAAGGVILLLTGSTEPVYRQAYPSHISIIRMLSWSAIRTRSFFIASLAGITLTFFFFAYEIGFYLLANRLGAWSPAEIPYTDLLNTRFPWIFVLLGGFFPAVSEEWVFRAFSIPFLKNLFRYRWIAVFLASFIWGFGHANYPNQPFFIRGLEVGVVGLILSWAMLRFGILAPLIAHYSIDAFYSAFLLLRSGNTYLVTSGAVTAGINLVPLLLAAGAYVVTRNFRSESTVTNEREGTAVELPPEPAYVEAPPAPRYEPLTRNKTYAAFALFAVGMLVMVIGVPRFGDFARFRLTASHATQVAKNFLARLNLDVGGYRQVTQPISRVDPLAVQYVYTASSINGLNALYGEHTRPLAWQARFYKPLEKEEFRVNVDPATGKVLSFHHLLPEEAPGADLPEQQAQDLAVSFLKSQGYDLSQYELKETKSEKPKQRRDTEFTWEARSGTSGVVGESRLRVQARILGDKIGSWTSSIKIPEEWRRSRERVNAYSIATLAVRIAFIVALLCFGIATLIRGIRQGLVPWKLAATIAAAFAVLELLDVVNAVPGFLFRYVTEMSMQVYSLVALVGSVLALVGAGLIAGLAVALIMSCYPDARAVFNKTTWGLRARDTVSASFAVVGAYWLLQWVTSLIQYRASRFALAPTISFPSNVENYVPIVSGVRDILVNTLLVSALLGFAAHVWTKLTTRLWMRALLLVGLFVTLLPSSARRLSEVAFGAAPSLLLILLAFGLVLIFLRGNYPAYLLSAALLSVVRSSSPLLGQGNLGLEIQGWLLWLVALGGMTLLLLYNRQFEDASRGQAIDHGGEAQPPT